MGRSGELRDVHTSSSTGCSRGDDNAGVEHLRSLAADDPAREQGAFGQIAAALRNDRTPGQQSNNDETDMAPCLLFAPRSIAVAAAAIAGPKIA